MPKIHAMVNVGVLLDAILAKHEGITECARAAGVSADIINRLLNFDGNAPQLDSVHRLLTYLELTNERLFIPCQPNETETI